MDLKTSKEGERGVTSAFPLLKRQQTTSASPLAPTVTLGCSRPEKSVPETRQQDREMMKADGQSVQAGGENLFPSFSFECVKCTSRTKNFVSDCTVW